MSTDYIDEVREKSQEQYRIQQAVRSFASEMERKMTLQIDKKAGWDDPVIFSDARLLENLQRAVHERDWLSVANYAMMAQRRGLKP